MSRDVVLRVAAVIALLALALMVVATFVPRPLPVILAMSVGQGLGVLAFLLYLSAVVSEMRRLRAVEERSHDDPARPVRDDSAADRQNP